MKRLEVLELDVPVFLCMYVTIRYILMSQNGIFLFEEKGNSKSVHTKRSQKNYGMEDQALSCYMCNFNSSCLCLYIKIKCLRIQEETYYLYFLDLYMTEYCTGKTEPIRKSFWTTVN